MRKSFLPAIAGVSALVLFGLFVARLATGEPLALTTRRLVSFPSIPSCAF